MARNSSRRRGFDAERELALRLWSHGFAVVRGPASGARAKRLFYPDLVAIYRGRVYVFEVKYWHSDTVYVDQEQAEKLREFARRAAATAFIAVKQPRRGWFLIRLEDAARTPSGRLRISARELEKAMRLEEFVRAATNKQLPVGGQPGKLSSQQEESSVRE